MTLENYFFKKNHKLMDKWVHYFEIYERHFRRYRGMPVKVLEIGVQNGGSLQMWKEYFGPESTIHGIDIDPSCMKHEDKENGIFVTIGDQGDRLFWDKFDEGPFDIIIDDGGHMMVQQIVTFEKLYYAKVKPGGVYLCEDTHTSYMEGYNNEKPTFIEYCKTLIDVVNKMDKKLNDGVCSIQFYNSVVVFEKEVYKTDFVPYSRQIANNF